MACKYIWCQDKNSDININTKPSIWYSTKSGNVGEEKPFHDGRQTWSESEKGEQREKKNCDASSEESRRINDFSWFTAPHNECATKSMLPKRKAN